MASTEESPDGANGTAGHPHPGNPPPWKADPDAPGQTSVPRRLLIGILLVAIAIPAGVSVVFERRAAIDALRTTRLETRLAALESRMQTLATTLADRDTKGTRPNQQTNRGTPSRSARTESVSAAPPSLGPAARIGPAPATMETSAAISPNESGRFALPSKDGLPGRGGPPIDPSEWAEFFAAKLLLGPLDADGREELRRLWNGHKAPTQRLVLDLLQSRFGIDWETFLVALQDPETGEEN